MNSSKGREDLLDHAGDPASRQGLSDESDAPIGSAPCILERPESQHGLKREASRSQLVATCAEHRTSAVPIPRRTLVATRLTDWNALIRRPDSGLGVSVRLAEVRKLPAEETLLLTYGFRKHVREAKERFTAGMQKIEEFQAHSVAGQPNWEFLRKSWPYGYTQRAVPEVFSRALTKRSETEGGYCSPAECVSRMGFEKADVDRVVEVCEIAFYAMLARQLRIGGRTCLPRDFKYFHHSHRDGVRRVLEAYPPLQIWLRPPAEFIDSLRQSISDNESVRLDETEPLGAVRRSGSDSLSIEHLREEAAGQHHMLTWHAMRAIMSLFWIRANAGFLSNRKQQPTPEMQHGANAFTQWTQIYKRTLDDALDQDHRRPRQVHWLPEYDVGMKESWDAPFDRAVRYVSQLSKRWNADRGGRRAAQNDDSASGPSGSSPKEAQ